MKIAILGAGNVGGTLGLAWAKAGHQIVFGVRNPQDDKIQELLKKANNSTAATTVTEAVKDAEVVVLATPWSAIEKVIENCGDLTGKILIDCTNPLAANLSGLTLGLTTSGGEKVAELAKGAKVYKAFNQVGANIMADPVFEGKKAIMFVCGDDEESKPNVIKLVEEIGFEAIDAGLLSMARLLEPYGLLWIKLAIKGQNRNFAFTLLKR